MNAAFFSLRPRSGAPVSMPGKALRARQIHRWIAVVFTLTVAINFAAMPWGQPPVWVVYAPLPPLLFLMTTGLTILISSLLGQARERARTPEEAVP